MSKLTHEVLKAFAAEPRTAILMSGRGTNAGPILRDNDLLDMYDFAAVVTDNPKSRAADIANQHGLELISQPHDRFETPADRAAYFSRLGDTLQDRGIQALIFAGFMKIVTAEFCERFPATNVHPADLSITDETGMAKYRGMYALDKMLQAEGCVRSTVHVVDTPVDAGSAIAVSESVYPLGDDETSADMHLRLQFEENRVYPITLAMLGRGAIELTDMPLLHV
jgi:phosphoribosylglycinamide formyltransferase 1